MLPMNMAIGVTLATSRAPACTAVFARVKEDRRRMALTGGSRFGSKFSSSFVFSHLLSSYPDSISSSTSRHHILGPRISSRTFARIWKRSLRHGASCQLPALNYHETLATQLVLVLELELDQTWGEQSLRQQ